MLYVIVWGNKGRNLNGFFVFLGLEYIRINVFCVGIKVNLKEVGKKKRILGVWNELVEEKVVWFDGKRVFL